MFSFKPYGFLFIFVLGFGSILSVSSLHWLGIWVGLEINLMGFIPILIYRGMTQETESGMKYFIIQALGSGMIMAGSLLFFNLSLTWEAPSSPTAYSGLLILLFGLMLKLGSFPFHFWLPSVMAGISWLSCLLLTTWQKLAPLFLLSVIVENWVNLSFFMTSFLLLSASLSSLVGGVGGVNQTQIRALLAYSSIGHIGWMLFCMTMSMSILKIYFLIYFTISISVFLTLWNSEKSLFMQTSNKKTESPKLNEVSLVFMLLSLGGMPPLLGFLGKWLVIWSSCMMKSYYIIGPLLVGSLISLFYYLTLLFSVSLLTSTKMNINSYLSINNHNSLNSFPESIHSTNAPPLKTSLLINMIFILNFMGGIMIMYSLPTFDFF